MSRWCPALRTLARVRPAVARLRTVAPPWRTGVHRCPPLYSEGMTSTPKSSAPQASYAFRAVVALGRRVHALRTKMATARHYGPRVVAYPSYGSTTQVRILARVLLASKPLPGGRSERVTTSGTENVRGWRAFTSVPVQFSEVNVEIDGELHVVTADSGGLVDASLPVTLEAGWHTALLWAPGTEPVKTQIFVIGDDTSFGIVSDIDDTVMVTALPRPFLALWNTFVLSERARTPTPGMAVLLDRIALEHPEAPVIYLSTGPWNAAPTLVRFLARNLYPAGTLLLTDWGPTQDRWFRSGREHKHRNLERLRREFPQVQWLLFGDNGQHDEEIYSAFAQQHPDAVAAVAIRQLSTGETVLAGGHSSSATPGGPATAKPWIYAPDGAGMAKQLEQLGIL
jgi:phosphatidate phosphatase APP1